MGCPVAGADGSPCGRPALEDGKCLFHSNSKKDVGEFEIAFLKFLSEENRTSEKVIDCSGFVFPDFAPNGKWHVGKFINLDRATFSGTTRPNFLIQKGASLNHARFLGDADFRNCEFHDAISFHSTEFHGALCCERVGFPDSVDFTNAIFHEDADFNHAEFDGMMICVESEFKKDAIFVNSVFKEGAWFGASIGRGKAVFFGAKFQDELIFSGAKFSSSLSFTNAEFSGISNFDRMRIEGRSAFSNCRFKKASNFEQTAFLDAADFQDSEFLAEAFFPEADFSTFAIFSRVKFHGGARFSSAQFSGMAEFDQMTTEAPIDFYGARFLGDSSFTSCRFEDSVWFTATRFAKSADFGESRFLSDAVFDRTAFLGRTHFANARFAGAARFKRAKIGEYLSFDRAEFSGDGHFQDLEFPKQIDPQGAALNFGSVVIRNVDGVRFEGRGGEPLDLSRTRFAFTDAYMIRFLNVSFSGIESSNQLLWKDRIVLWLLNRTPGELVRIYDEENVQDDSHNQHDSDSTTERYRTLRWEHVGAIYKNLRESYERRFRYDEAGLFHIQEMEARRLAAGQKGKGRFGRWRRRNLSLLNAYRWLSLYGESYRLAAIWIVATILLFSVARWLLEASLDGDAASILSSLIDSLGEHLTTSVLAFLQLRSDTTIDLMERITGAILVVLFGMALHRNFKR